MIANYLWLRRYASEYRGHWVALNNGTLVGYCPDRVELQHELRTRDAERGTLVVKL